MPKKPLNQKTALITGASSGLGFEISDFSDIKIESDTEVDLLLFSMPYI